LEEKENSEVPDSRAGGTREEKKGLFIYFNPEQEGERRVRAQPNRGRRGRRPKLKKVGKGVLSKKKKGREPQHHFQGKGKDEEGKKGSENQPS